MQKQERILKKFIKKYNNPTIKQIAKLTGVQHTRVFRLFNSAEMKLSEYEVFKKLVYEENSCKNQLHQLITTCQNRMSLQILIEIQDYIEERLKGFELINTELFSTH